jgi:predicted nucleotidyltransferase
MSTLDIIRQHLPDLRREYHVTRIGLFGSFARGDQRRSSDIDLLVEFKSGHKDLFNFIRLKFHLEKLLKRNVDLVMRSALKPRLKRRILSEVQDA